MKKRLTAIVVSLCMVVSVSNVVFANGEDDSYKTITGEEETIPVYGYLGPDKSVTPPDTGDGGEPSSVEIYVEVPTKILFAAFESNEGKITSPKFTITNLSDLSDIKVEIESFEQRNSDEVNLDGRLSLKLVDINDDDVVPELFPSSYHPLGKLLIDNLSKSVEGAGSNKFVFMVGGVWSGSFDEELQPVFDMVVKFSGVE